MRRLAVVVAALLAAGCARSGLTVLSEAELPADVYGSPEPQASASPLPRIGYIYMVDRGKLERRRVSLQGIVAAPLPEALLVSLLSQARTEGPQGRPTTEIPEGTRLNGVSVAGPVATVDMSGDFERAAPRRSQALRIAQVVYTLTEPGTNVQSVRFEIDGVPQVAIGGVELRSIVGPVERDDFAQFAPVDRENDSG